MPPHTSTRIMTYIQTMGSATCEELSLALRMTRANIHYHLATLLKNHRIRRTEDESPAKSKRGRKSLRFTLNDDAFPDNYLNLANGLLTFLLNSPHFDKITDFQKLTSILFNPPPLASNSLNRLNAAVIKLNESNYSASWEARKTGPHFFFHNCPYRKIIAPHPQLCMLDHHILETLTGFHASQTHKADLPLGILYCEFLLELK
jgi:predicted ArsR family transcriptional regulator